MKKGILSVLLMSILVSCGDSKKDEAKEKIEKFLLSKLDQPETYEMIKIERKDFMISDSIYKAYGIDDTAGEHKITEKNAHTISVYGKKRLIRAKIEYLKAKGYIAKYDSIGGEEMDKLDKDNIIGRLTGKIPSEELYAIFVSTLPNLEKEYKEAKEEWEARRDRYNSIISTEIGMDRIRKCHYTLEFKFKDRYEVKRSSTAHINYDPNQKEWSGAWINHGWLSFEPGFR